MPASCASATRSIPASSRSWRSSEDTRIHDSPVDIFGEDRNSNGTSAKLGGDFNLFGSLTGEMAVGYMERDYMDPTLPNIGGVTLDGSLLWQATRADHGEVHRGIDGQRIDPARRVRRLQPRFQRRGRPRVPRAGSSARRRSATATTNMSASARDDNRYFASAGLTYKLNREMQLKGTVREDWLTSNVTRRRLHRHVVPAWPALAEVNRRKKERRAAKRSMSYRTSLDRFASALAPRRIYTHSGAQRPIRIPPAPR